MNPLRLRVGTATVLRALANGNVGIGTASPVTRLDVSTPSGVAIRGISSGGGFNAVGVAGAAPNGGVGVHASSTDTGLEAHSTSGGAAVLAVCDTASWSRLYEGYADSLAALTFKVDCGGNVTADGTFTGGGADYADLLPVFGNANDFAPGDVLVIDPNGMMVKADQPYATNVAGVYSTKPAFVGDSRGVTQKPTVEEGLVPVALVGVVPVKVTTENGAIQPGDLLVTSSTPGHAMKARPVMINGIAIYPTGAILGKALESLEQGTGVIKALVMLR